MSYFRIPKSLFDEINKKCARFWWGSVGDKRKLHWASWRRLSKWKDAGGTGFRDLHLFNKAMLAKQSWRILRNLGSILFKVLRGRYLKNGDFLNASIGNYSLQAWRSIAWGRELFKKGYRWRVVNGRYIYIDSDPWMIRKGSRSPLFVPKHLKGKQVELLIKSNGDPPSVASRSYV